MSVFRIRKSFPALGGLRGFTNLALIIIAVLLAAAGCKDRSSGEPGQAAVAPVPQKVPVLTPVPGPPEKQDSPPVLEYDDIVLARVNGDPVTQYDLNLALRSVLGDRAADADRLFLRKALRSLVATRAAAQARETAMSDTDLAALEKKVRAYREKLLASRYLADHTAPGPVTREMILEYYNSHPELFGSRTVRMYEMIAADRKTDFHEQKALAALLGNARLKEDWKEWAETLTGRGFPLAYRTGQADREVTDPRLYKALQSLGKGETSPVIFINGMCNVARITGVTETGPGPSEEAGAEIRKLLRFRKASGEVLEQLLGKAGITYEKDPQKPQ